MLAHLYLLDGCVFLIEYNRSVEVNSSKTKVDFQLGTSKFRQETTGNFKAYLNPVKEPDITCISVHVIETLPRCFFVAEQ